STRSNSPTPVGRARATSAFTCPIGTAGAVTAPGATICTPARAPSSSTVPHAWHSPQRPTHLVVRHPHSAHRYPVRCAALLMAGTLPRSADKLPSAGGGRVRPATTDPWWCRAPAAPRLPCGRGASCRRPARPDQTVLVRSVVAVAQHVGVGDLQAGGLRDGPLRHLGGELDAQHRFQVGPALEDHAQVERLPFPALPGPEVLDGAGGVRREGLPKPAAEVATGRVDVDDERGAAASHDA